jgi:hypothetical protein
MKTLRRYITLAISMVAVTTQVLAADFGGAKDVKQVRKMVAAKFGHALHASVSHDWALCTAYTEHSGLSVVLHRAESGWKIVESDGGAYAEENLKGLGVPQADIPALLRAYQ